MGPGQSFPMFLNDQTRPDGHNLASSPQRHTCEPVKWFWGQWNFVVVKMCMNAYRAKYIRSDQALSSL